MVVVAVVDVNGRTIKGASISKWLSKRKDRDNLREIEFK